MFIVKIKALFFIVITFFNLVFCFSQNRLVEIEINNVAYLFELAKTPKERSQGLMYREYLEQDSGMLFVFNNQDYLTFHMRNTQIPLDIAFIDEDGLVIDIQSMEPFDSALTVSKKPAKYALEVNRGFFKRVNLSVGDILKISVP